MGLANLAGIDEVIEVNRRNYEDYRRELDGIPGAALLPVDGGNLSNYQYIVLEILESCPAERDEVLARLRENNVLARRYFWPGCHRMEPYRTLYPEASTTLPQTERVADRVIVLPTAPASMPRRFASSPVSCGRR